MKWFSRNTNRKISITPEDTFFDDVNIGGMDEQQLEGVLEQSLPTRMTVWLAGGFVCVLVLFVFQLVRLQVFEGDEYYARSQDNRFFEETIFAQRGVIFDRNDTPLAWNQEGDDRQPFERRMYIPEGGFAHVLGYVQYPQLDRNGFYWQRETIGQSGIEAFAQETLAGKNGALLTERSASGDVSESTTLRESIDGKNIHTTLDADLQTRLFDAIESIVSEDGYEAGAGVFINVQDGGIHALTNYPQYDNQILSDNTDSRAIREFLRSSRGYFLNRAVQGLYSPGSTIKPFVALAALHEGIIDESTTIYSSGRIEIPNPFNPDAPSIFRDWRRTGHGLTDVRFAIADSVNTFFYAISGGLNDQAGLGIDRMSAFLERFAVGQSIEYELGTTTAGVIPTPQWKEEIFDDRWRLGDTYITSIGQFGFQVTPLQMAYSVAALASNGNLVKPRILQETPIRFDRIDGIENKYYDLVREGMRQTVTRGTAQLLHNLPEEFAVKTGTAQVSVRDGINNSWIVGMYPYQNPEIAFAIVLERGPNEGARSATHVIWEVFRERLEIN